MAAKHCKINSKGNGNRKFNSEECNISHAEREMLMKKTDAKFLASNIKHFKATKRKISEAVLNRNVECK